MISLVLEHPIALALVWLLIQAVLVTGWYSWRTRWARRLMLIGFAALPILEAVSFSVVTPREEVVTLCRELASAVERTDIPAIERQLGEKFETIGLSRTEFLSAVERSLQRFHVKQARLHRFEVAFPQRGQAVAEFNASCFVVGSHTSGQRLLSRWRVTVRQTASGWRVTAIEALPTAFSPIRSLRDVLR